MTDASAEAARGAPPPIADQPTSVLKSKRNTLIQNASVETYEEAQRGLSLVIGKKREMGGRVWDILFIVTVPWVLAGGGGKTIGCRGHGMNPVRRDLPCT